jgi:hypothetical protein
VTQKTGEAVRVGLVVLVSVSELGTKDITNPGLSNEMVAVGMVELAFDPELVSIERVVVFDSSWEKSGVILETDILVSVGWVTDETVVSNSSGETV